MAGGGVEGTQLEYALHPVGPTITGGPIVHSIERARALLDVFRDSTHSLPDEHTLFATLTHAPDDSGTPVAALVTCHFLTELSDAAIDTMIDCFARCPTPMGQLLLEHFHGAVARIEVGDTAFPHRREGYNFLVLAQWTQPVDTGACVAWARETYERMRSFFAAGRYVNCLEQSVDPGGLVIGRYL
ncbi:hypothetical protein [Variovorax sp. PBL-E5]|uniref:hypothetical protein n=1 Tax=Variovorax sp. PBL-E5 TaxID=434014 RepID=UPI0013A5B79D|nr:hypothetical protein [Variovorax sp. PBL-E5]